MKVRPDVLRLYKEVHSWVGILAGLFLFVAFYAGGLTTLEGATREWTAPPARGLPAPVAPERLDDLVRQAAAADPRVLDAHTVVLKPDAAHPSSLMWSVSRDPNHEHGPGLTAYAGFGPGDALVIGKRAQPATVEVVNYLHQRIGLPLNRDWGRPVMGIVALLYVVALVSGTIAILPSLARTIFTLRLGPGNAGPGKPDEGARRRWHDFHTLLGVCSLPFHIVIATTALGFAFQMPVSMLQGALFAPAPHTGHERGHDGGGHARQGRGGPRPVADPSAVLAAVKAAAPDFSPSLLEYGMRGGRPTLFATGPDDAHLSRSTAGAIIALDPYTGSVLSPDDPFGRRPPGEALTGAMHALHFGNLGGFFWHVCYAALGFGGAYLFYSGNRLWLDSRRRRERAEGRSGKGTRALSALTSGWMIGTVCGVSAVFAAAPLLPETGIADGGNYVTLRALFYAVLFVCLGLAAWLGGERSLPLLLCLAGAATLLVPFAYPVSIVPDAVALIYGAALVIAALRTARAGRAAARSVAVA